MKPKDKIRRSTFFKRLPNQRKAKVGFEVDIEELKKNQAGISKLFKKR